MFTRSSLPAAIQRTAFVRSSLLRELVASASSPPPLALARRAFSTSASAEQRARSSRPPLRSRLMSGLPPPVPRGRFEQPPAEAYGSEGANRTPIGRIIPVRVPASEARAGTGTTATAAEEPVSASLAVTFNEEELRGARPNVLRPVLWAILTAGTVYVAAAMITNEDTAEWAEKLGAGSFWRRTQPTQKEMMDAKRLALMKDLQDTVGSLQKALSSFPAGFANTLLHGYVAIAENWLNTSEAKRFASAAIYVNALIFIGWRIPRLQRTMAAMWTHSPISGKSYTLLTSAFSHAEFWHFGFNMFALWSFTPMAYSFLVHGDRAALSSFPGMQESTAVWHLTAFYLAAAIFASLGSHLHSNLVALPRFLARLSSAASAGVQIPRAELFRLARKAQLNGSVGASGALYAIMAVGALSFPHAQVGIIFLPFISFPITWAVGALCLLDLVGLIRAWQMFNHAAHLSGAIFGGLYWRYGCDLWDWTLQKLRAPRPRGSSAQVVL